MIKLVGHVYLADWTRSVQKKVGNRIKWPYCPGKKKGKKKSKLHWICRHIVSLSHGLITILELSHGGN